MLKSGEELCRHVSLNPMTYLWKGGTICGDRGRRSFRSRHHDRRQPAAFRLAGRAKCLVWSCTPSIAAGASAAGRHTAPPLVIALGAAAGPAANGAEPARRSPDGRVTPSGVPKGDKSVQSRRYAAIYFDLARYFPYV